MAIKAYAGEYPVLGLRAYVDEAALVIGRVRLGEDVSVWPFAVIRGDVAPIEIGARTNVQDGCVLHVVHDGPYTPGGIGLSVGEDVTVGHKAVLHAARIGDRCLIGIGAIVLDGAEIAAETIVGAGSVVPPGRRLEAGGLYLGNPAKRVRDLSAAELERLVYGARHYVAVKDEYRAAARGAHR
ncbi:MAG: gamma carbonic anhydrase family protein [Gammaproteobacteria bacterium]|nr:gamma carbonic anhydrase family protein [Gammaproteobacteria bacterium]